MSKTKFLILCVLTFLSIGIVDAERWLSNRSSRTITAETTARIVGSGPGDTISSVIISSCSASAGSLFRLYDSSLTTTGQIAALHTSTAPSGALTKSCIEQYDFFIRLSSAITYTTTNACDVTILWQDELDR